MRGEVVAFGLASSRPRGRENGANPLGSTPRIGHVVRPDRWKDLAGDRQDYRGFTAKRGSVRTNIRPWLLE